MDSDGCVPPHPAVAGPPPGIPRLKSLRRPAGRPDAAVQKTARVGVTWRGGRPSQLEGSGPGMRPGSSSSYLSPSRMPRADARSCPLRRGAPRAAVPHAHSHPHTVSRPGGKRGIGGWLGGGGSGGVEGWGGGGLRVEQGCKVEDERRERSVERERVGGWGRPGDKAAEQRGPFSLSPSARLPMDTSSARRLHKVSAVR
jgi:hypothetical protein